MWEEYFQFDSAKYHRFLFVLQFSSFSNTGSTRDGPYWNSRKNSVELIELSSIYKVSLV
jgi:hypothetical protein